ncbi:MAG TPA: hypothetical protein VEG60_04315 [Candidatus Binatia bacterium]|nr:hypothetical protein [Candidatus Binatia bacterium]
MAKFEFRNFTPRALYYYRRVFAQLAQTLQELETLGFGDSSRQGAKSAKFGPSPEDGFGPQGG